MERNQTCREYIKKIEDNQTLMKHIIKNLAKWNFGPDNEFNGCDNNHNQIHQLKKKEIEGTNNFFL